MVLRLSARFLKYMSKYGIRCIGWNCNESAKKGLIQLNEKATFHMCGGNYALFPLPWPVMDRPLDRWRSLIYVKIYSHRGGRVHQGSELTIRQSPRWVPKIFCGDQNWCAHQSLWILIRGRPNRGVKRAIPENGPEDDLAETAAVLNHGGKRLESLSHWVLIWA